MHAVLVLLALALQAPAAPSPPTAPETRAFLYSAYEEDTIASALDRLGLVRDPDAEGKRVESVHVLRLEVIEERDPAPRFLNVFHVVTRESVVLSEVLVRPGDEFRRTFADETRRKLSALPQLSLVLVVTARGSADGLTRVVVVTKDVWSLRLNWDISVTSGGLERLTMNPSETNLLGTTQRVGALLDLLPASVAVGANYGAPRLRGGDHSAADDAGLVVERATGSSEGAFATAELARPLRSSRDPWAWGLGGSWSDQIARRYSGRDVVLFALDLGTDCAATPALCLPYAWRAEVAAANASLTRSTGWARKHDVSVGAVARSSRYSVEDAPAFDPATVRAFADTRLPVGEDRVYPFARWRTYSTNFLRVTDLDTLALQEDHGLGFSASTTVYPVLRAVGSSRDLLGAAASAGWTAPLRDGLVRVSAEVAAELDAELGDVSDGSVRAGIRFASPRGRLGRVVLDATVLDRYANYLRGTSSLGGSDRLRGHPSGHVLGASAVVANLELRSRPIALFETVQVGGVLFYDTGDAFDRWRDLRLRQAAGVGARVLLPQLDRTVFRVDLGFPIASPAGEDLAPASFVVTFGQAL